MTTKLTKKEQTRVLEWCSGWFDLAKERRCTLEEWVMLKLGCTQPQAKKYAAWLRGCQPLGPLQPPEAK